MLLFGERSNIAHHTRHKSVPKERLVISIPIRRKPECEVYALLWLSENSQSQITSLLSDECGILYGSIQRNMHLTVYHGRRELPGLTPSVKSVKIVADVAETRFMVLAPGGENPRPGLIPSESSIGIRLTRRNQAIPEIMELRRSVYQKETPNIVRNRPLTSDWTSAFGARHYQPHIRLIRPGSGVDDDLTKIGKIFRSKLEVLEFDRFGIRIWYNKTSH